MGYLLRLWSEVSLTIRGIRGIGPEAVEEGYGGKDLRKRKFLSLE